MAECKTGAVHEIRLRHGCCENLDALKQKLSVGKDVTGYVMTLEKLFQAVTRWRQEEETAFTVATLVEAHEAVIQKREASRG